MKDPYEEFIDDVLCFDGHYDPIPGSNADCNHDADEIAEFAKLLGMEPVKTDVI
jgi:hypothetical protein